MHDRGIASVELEALLRPAYIVPETKDLAALLAEFRNQNQHMAVVVDEYGAMQGIVTLEDLLEEIVGEIEDEYDLPDESVERIDERRIRIDGTFPIDDFNEQFGTEIEVEDYHTMAGYVFGLLGRAPEVGDEMPTDGIVMRVARGRGLAHPAARGRVRRAARGAGGGVAPRCCRSSDPARSSASGSTTAPTPRSRTGRRPSGRCCSRSGRPR